MTPQTVLVMMCRVPSQVLHDWGDADCRTLLARAYEVPGHRDDQESAAQRSPQE